MIRDAIVSPDGLYRYSLTRDWTAPGESPRALCVCLLNPSKADAQKDDPTVLWLIAFARRFNFTRLEVVNLYAWRSTDPEALRTAADPVGPQNDAHLRWAFAQARWIFCAWGRNAPDDHRAPRVLNMIKATNQAAFAFRINKDGTPTHPVRLRRDLAPVVFR